MLLQYGDMESLLVTFTKIVKQVQKLCANWGITMQTFLSMGN